MELQKVILFYKFTSIADPDAILQWQRTLSDFLGLRGRIIISPHGINGTLGGAMSALKKYIKATKKYPSFKKTVFKWSDGTGNEFPRLNIKVRDELVAFGSPDEITVDESGVIGGGVHLRPEQVHELVAARGDEVVFFDGRNAFEAKIGKFKDAIIPDVVTTRGFIEEIESGKYDHLKNKPIVAYCTGGIRCEILTVVMKNRGFAEVYQLDGGIVKYGDKYGDKGLWEGSLYTFDSRMAIDFSGETKIIGECEKCKGATKKFVNCARPECHELVLLCTRCASADDKTPCVHDFDRRGKRLADSEMIG